MSERDSLRVSKLKRDLFAAGFMISVVTVFGIMSYFAFRSDEQHRTHLTAEVPCIITDVYASRGRSDEYGGSRGVDNIRVSYQYKINGRAFAHTTALNYDEGKAIRLEVLQRFATTRKITMRRNCFN
jgi:hypothetical protein